MENQKETSPEHKKDLKTWEQDSNRTRARDEGVEDQGSTAYQELYGRPGQKNRNGKDSSDSAGEFGSAAIPPGPEGRSGEQIPVQAKKEK